MSVIGDCPGGMRAALVGIAFSTSARRARYLPIGHTALDEPSALNPNAALAALKPVLENPSLAKIGHDLKFDLMMLAHEGIALKGLEFDTMLASYVLDATRSSHTIEEIALEHLGYKALTQEDICGTGQKAIRAAPSARRRAAEFRGRARRSGVAARREARRAASRRGSGAAVPRPGASARAGAGGHRSAMACASTCRRSPASRPASTPSSRRAARKIFELAGEEFNINSPKQLSVILFDKLQLPTAKRTGKTKVASTAVDVLEDLALTHELPKLILEWRALMKLKGTYIDALPQLVHSRTARVHTSFNQAVAATGRLSSSDPNLQNIPIRTDLGREIRRAFIADPGFVLISADYSQIELRVLAHLAAEDALIEAFRRGEDIHDRTALKVFGPNSGLDKHELRRRAKIINYALLLRKDRLHARARHRRHAGCRAGVHRRILRRVSARPHVHRRDDRSGADQRVRRDDVRAPAHGARAEQPQWPDPAGRRADDGELSHSGHGRRHPEEGHAARVRCALARQGGCRWAKGRRAARMILTVHDELLIESPEDSATAVAEQVREAMQGAAALKVPLTVDVGIGPNWREAKS